MQKIEKKYQFQFSKSFFVHQRWLLDQKPLKLQKFIKKSQSCRPGTVKCPHNQRYQDKIDEKSHQNAKKVLQSILLSSPWIQCLKQTPRKAIDTYNS